MLNGELVEGRLDALLPACGCWSHGSLCLSCGGRLLHRKRQSTAKLRTIAWSWRVVVSVVSTGCGCCWIAGLPAATEWLLSARCCGLVSAQCWRLRWFRRVTLPRHLTAGEWLVHFELGRAMRLLNLLLSPYIESGEKGRSCCGLTLLMCLDFALLALVLCALSSLLGSLHLFLMQLSLFLLCCFTLLSLSFLLLFHAKCFERFSGGWFSSGDSGA